jgi:hypothetical protein
VSLLGELKQGCETYREQALNGRLATAEEIAKQWPGGEYNPGKTVKQWAGCYGWLKGLCLQIKARDDRREADISTRQAVIMAAMEERPETVECSVGPLTVYQKSKVALEEIDCLNRWLASYVDKFNELTAGGVVADIEVINRIVREQSYLERILVWIATTEGPGLPYPEQASTAELPEHLANLHAIDFYQIAQAFQRVNVAGFAALEASRVNGTRPGWHVFWAAAEESTGVPAPRLMRDRGLLSLVAASSVRVKAMDDARAEAESKHKRSA